MKRLLCLFCAVLLLTPLCMPRVSAAEPRADEPDRGAITFTESENFPMPGADGPLPKGHPFSIDGVVKSRAPLLCVKATVKNSRGKTVLRAEQTFAEDENVTEYRLLDPTYSDEIECFSEKLRFERLAAGSYTLKLTAEDAKARRVTLCTASFRVTADKWVRLLPNNLRNNYTDALRFFGSPERFLFRYRFAKGRKITVDSAWNKQYAASAKGVDGKRWRCHRDAVPYFEQAARLIENTYIRVRGTNGDTGAVRLAAIMTFNGLMVQRYVSSLEYISHHSFGTAVDVNAYTPSHRNVPENREKIFREVTEHLTYNGLKRVGSRICYDFTYTGDAESGPKNVPEPLLNYLLYELAFFRAGFSWGLYYPHTCDGMHFSLSELSPDLFENSPYAMRKVFVYLEDLRPPVITRQPKSVKAAAGDRVRFTVVAEGDDLTYQWYCRKPGSDRWQRVSNARSRRATLILTAKEANDGCSYRCMVRSANVLRVTSKAVTLRILP